MELLGQSGRPIANAYSLTRRLARQMKKRRTVSCFPRYVSSIAYGTLFAILSAHNQFSGRHVELFTIAANAQAATPRNLTAEFEGNCSDWTNSDLSDEHLMPAPAWSADDATLYVLAAYRGTSHIFAVSTKDGAGKQPPTLTPGNVH